MEEVGHRMEEVCDHLEVEAEVAHLAEEAEGHLD